MNCKSKSSNPVFLAVQTHNQLHRHNEVSVREANVRSLPRPLARQIAVGRTKDACRSCSRRQVIALLHFRTRPLTLTSDSLSMFTANFLPDSLPLLDDPFDYAPVVVRTPLLLPALQTPQPQCALRPDEEGLDSGSSLRVRPTRVTAEHEPDVQMRCRRSGGTSPPLSTFDWRHRVCFFVTLAFVDSPFRSFLLMLAKVPADMLPRINSAALMWSVGLSGAAKANG